jgi:hypothetical protein
MNLEGGEEKGGQGGGGFPSEENVGGAPEGGWNGAGRPKEIPKFGKDKSARGRDPLGVKDMKKGISMEAIKKMTKNIPLKTDDKEILKETLDTEEEYKDYIRDNEDNDDK